MTVKRTFHFPMSTLLYEADLILSAAEDQPAFTAKRLPADFVSTARANLVALGGRAATRRKRPVKPGS